MKRWFISPRTKCQEYWETDLFEVERSSLFSKLPFKVEIVARGWSSRGISSYISIQHVQTCASFIHCTKHRPHCKKQLFVSICIHGKLGLFSGFVKRKKRNTNLSLSNTNNSHPEAQGSCQKCSPVIPPGGVRGAMFLGVSRSGRWVLVWMTTWPNGSDAHL